MLTFSMSLALPENEECSQSTTRSSSRCGSSGNEDTASTAASVQPHPPLSGSFEEGQCANQSFAKIMNPTVGGDDHPSKVLETHFPDKILFIKSCSAFLWLCLLAFGVITTSCALIVPKSLLVWNHHPHEISAKEYSTNKVISRATRYDFSGRFLQDANDTTSNSTTNVFHKEHTAFLVHWGTIRAGCRPPSKALMDLDCKGGNIQVLYSSNVDCHPTSAEHAVCGLDHASVEYKNLDWTQGLVIAQCFKTSRHGEDSSPIEFHATFDMDFPSLCAGVPSQQDTEDGVTLFGGFETFMVSTQLCCDGDNGMRLIPSSSIQMEEEVGVLVFGSETIPFYQATDSCRVPTCPAHFRCTGSNFCKVRPAALQAIFHADESCQVQGLDEIDTSEELWNVLQSQVPSPGDLVDAGLGVGWY